MISEYALRGYLAQLTTRGWGMKGYGSLLDGWHLIYPSRLEDHDVFLDVDEEWVYLQCPLLRCAPHPDCRAALHEFLMRANEGIFFAKFALTPDPGASHDETVTLISEAPVENLDAALFRLMAEAIVRYAEDYGRELRSIALDPAIAALIATVEGAAGDPAIEIVLEGP